MSPKLLKVYTPNKNFSGFRYGVKFVKGEGMATEKQAKVLVANFRYACPELEAPAGEAGQSNASNTDAGKSSDAETPAKQEAGTQDDSKKISTGEKPENTSAKQPNKWNQKR